MTCLDMVLHVARTLERKGAYRDDIEDYLRGALAHVWEHTPAGDTRWNIRRRADAIRERYAASPLTCATKKVLWDFLSRRTGGG